MTGIPAFPHLRVGTFIEAAFTDGNLHVAVDFPTFGWGLSLRLYSGHCQVRGGFGFPHLRVGTFIEAVEA